jgi:pyridoxamine 5'-phosphate oxidase
LEFTAQTDPFQQFGSWLQEAELRSGMDYPNSMALATVDGAGRPSVRILLLKTFSPDGFVFFTNYESRKGSELEFNPQASLCFYWDKLGRQVRIDGTVEKLPRAESEAYFHTRPRLSQIGAWASRQSQEIPSRDHLETKVKELEEKFQDGPIPLPDFWGGYVLKADRFEFWQQGAFRLHDRFLFERAADGWSVRRLSP